MRRDLESDRLSRLQLNRIRCLSRRNDENVPATSEAPIDLLQSLALPVVLLTVGDFDSAKTIVTTVSYASLSPLRLSQFFPSDSSTAKMVLESRQFTLSVAALEQMELVKAIGLASSSEQPPFYHKDLVRFFGNGDRFYFRTCLFALDCQVERVLEADGCSAVISLVRGWEKGGGSKPLVRFEHGYGTVDGTIFSDDSYPI